MCVFELLNNLATVRVSPSLVSPMGGTPSDGVKGAFLHPGLVSYPRVSVSTCISPPTRHVLIQQLFVALNTQGLDRVSLHIALCLAETGAGRQNNGSVYVLIIKLSMVCAPALTWLLKN